jgi:hypothetical protein
MAVLAASVNRRKYRIFMLSVAFTAILMVFAGFARSYYLNGYFLRRSLTWILHLHGFIFSLWFLLLPLQIVLVAIGRTDLHRRVGTAGACLAATMVPLGAIVAIRAAKYGSPSTPPGVSRLTFLIVPFTDVFVFGVLVGAAILYRRRPEFHKRLMVLATLSILSPAVGRMPILQPFGVLAIFGLVAVAILIFIAYDTAFHKYLHPANLWGGLLVILSFPVRLFVGTTAPWLTFADWLTQL